MRARVPATGVLLLVLVGCELPTDARAPAVSANGTKLNGVLLEVKFQEDLEVRLDAQGQPRSARGANLGTLRSTLARLKVGAVRPLVTLPVATLEAMTQEATRRSGRRAPDLASWYRLVLPAGADTAAALTQLRALAEVSDAYVAPVSAPLPATPNFVPNQNNYFGAAPSGTENVYARSLAGGRGAGIRVIDIEFGWNFTHEDLGQSSAILIAGTPRFSTDNNNHGTAVLGILVARDNGFGVTGGAPDAIVRVASPYFVLDYRPADAIAAASNYADPGDVILLEQQVDGPASGSTDYVPVEWITSVRDAIQVATQAGRIVVEAAGNGNQNLDAAIFNGRFNRANDSRAIIVGAGDGTNARLSFSNYGSRLDVQAHGNSVTTTGYGSLFGTSAANFYTSTFGGTSSASAVVAAGATSLQGYLRARGRPLLTAPEMASLFQATGSAQTGSTTQRIGPKLNLRAAIARLDAPIAAPGLATRCSAAPGRDGNPRVVVDVTQNAPGTALSVERLGGTTWGVIKVLLTSGSGVYTYNTGFPSGTFRARATLAGSFSAYSAVVSRSC
jgi:serine protease